MPDQIADHLEAHKLADHLQGVGAQTGEPHLDHRQKPEADRQHPQQVEIAARDRLINHQLVEERGRKNSDL